MKPDVLTTEQANPRNLTKRFKIDA